MKIYLVGGAVRDILLNKEPKDKDYVIVGATKEDVKHLEETLFFKINEKTGEKEVTQVGKSFPVYLHPETLDEYALARKEKKTGVGYHGFSFEFDEFVTLEEDLLRRDLTINSMAMDLDTKEIFDPFGGQEDLKKGLLRATSDAFKEDPLRVLRAARFATQLNFLLSEELKVAMRTISKSGELSNLSRERILKETNKVLLEENPSVFFKALKETSALKAAFASLDSLSKTDFDNLCNLLDKHKGDVLSKVFLLYFLTEDSLLDEFKLSKKDSKLFRGLKQNLQGLCWRQFIPVEFIEFIKRSSLLRSNIALPIAKDNAELLFNGLNQKLEKALDTLKSLSVEDELKGVSGKDIPEKIKELQLEALRKL